MFSQDSFVGGKHVAPGPSFGFFPMPSSWEAFSETEHRQGTKRARTDTEGEVKTCEAGTQTEESQHQAQGEPTAFHHSVLVHFCYRFGGFVRRAALRWGFAGLLLDEFVQAFDDAVHGRPLSVEYAHK